MCGTMDFMRHCANTGTVFAGMGLMWKILTCGVPMRNTTAMRTRTLEGHSVLQMPWVLWCVVYCEAVQRAGLHR